MNNLYIGNCQVASLYYMLNCIYAYNNCSVLSLLHINKKGELNVLSLSSIIYKQFDTYG